MTTYSTVSTELETDMKSNWEAMVAQSAAYACRRSAAQKRWEKRLENARFATLVVGAFLLVEFPIACFTLQAVQARAIEYCATIYA